MYLEKMNKTTAIYVRVSTEKQELKNQLMDLRRYCKKQGWKIFRVYSDIVSGKEVREEKRPGFTGLFNDAHKKVFDVVLFWDLSRFSRSGTLYTLQKLQELKNSGIDWVSYQEPYISSLGQFSDVVVSIMATLARLEREKISERTKAGMRRAAAEGKKAGRPGLQEEVKKQVRELLARGGKVRAIAKKLNISRGSVGNMKNVHKRGVRIHAFSSVEEANRKKRPQKERFMDSTGGAGKKYKGRRTYVG